MSSFIQKDEFKKYLKHATGEILVTVIGIIIGLQVHVWTEKKVDEREVERIMKNLEDEFVLNEDNFQACRKELLNSLGNAKELIDLIGTKESQLKTLNIDSLMAVSFAYKKFAPSEDVISVLLETGNLKLITDDKMRNLLYTWSGNKAEIHNRFEDLESNTHKLFSYLTLHYPLKDLDYYTSERLLGKSKLSINKYLIFQDIVFENHLDNEIFYMQSYLDGLDKTHQIMKEIVDYAKEIN
jgi:hypothetical protein